MKYGEFSLMCFGYRNWVIIAKNDFKVDLCSGGVNFYGTVIRRVSTMKKGIRIIREYEKRMGRMNDTQEK